MVKRKGLFNCIVPVGLITIFLITLTISVFSQNIPTARTTEWNIAGYEGEIPCLSTLRNVVSEFGIDNTGAKDVSAAVQTAVNSINNNEVLYFPIGTYLFNNTVNVPSNRIIRGESPTLTKFIFTMGGDKNLFYTSGTKGADVAISAIQAHGGNTITVATTSGLSVGDDIEIEQDNDPAIHYIDATWNVTWAQSIKGQIIKIKAINGNELTIDRSLTFDYDLTFAMRMRKITAATNVGYENFYLQRTDANTGVSTNNNFNFIYANNCWMRRVHSYYTARYHVRIDHSRNIEVRECEFEKADDCSGGGEGYGVLTEIHTEDCLIEDNILHDIRHPLITKQGSSRNVYAYNYCFNLHNDAACSTPDSTAYACISLHGHYPAYNLYEGNIGGRVTISDAWGPAGPCNTIFRNRVQNNANGVWTAYYSNNQNILANEVIAPGKISDNRDNTLTGTLLLENNVQGTIDKKASLTVENSLYLTSKPSFFGSLPWPSIGTGTTFGSGTIPAKVRWESGVTIPLTQLCSACQIPNLGDIKSLCGASSVTLTSNVSATNRTFTWYKETTLLTGQTTKDINVSAAGTYKVVADSLGCVNSAQVVVSSVLTCNLGTDFTLCNPSVKTIDAGNASVPSVSYKWNTGETTRTIDVIAVGTYVVTVSASGCPSVSDTILASSNLLQVNGANLSAPGVANISVTGTSLYNWFSAITNGSILSTGNTYSPTVNNTTMYYVEDANGVTAIIGNSTISTNGYYNADNTVRYYFDVSRALTINEITVFTQAAQTVVINIYDASGTVIKSVSQAVATGEQIIVCNVSIPIGTGYYVDMTGTTGKLWRDKQDGVFPYSIPGVISINQTFPTFLITNAYYAFWYKWKITSGNACARTPVKVTVSNANPNTQTIQLQKGWNLISINRNLADSSISTIFTGLDVQEVKTADAFWRKGQNIAFNSLQKLTVGLGYMVNMNVAGTLSITGTTSTKTLQATSLLTGWNLVGCPYQTTTTLSTLFNATNTQTVKNFDGFWIPNGSTNSISSIDPSKGYFIKK